jgi:phenol 2-monooxygenase
MLDQLDLLDDLNQIGYICRNSVTWKDGKRITSRGWHLMFDRMDGTFMDYCLNLRQRYSEDVIREAYIHAGGQLHMGWKLEDFSLHLSQNTDFKVTGTICRVGADNERVTINR